MFRSLDSLMLGVAALLVSAGLLIASVPAAGDPVPVAADPPCPSGRVVIVEPGLI